jgi:spermidine synthase
MIPIETIESEFGTIEISQNPATGALIYKVGGRQQGEIDGNGISLAHYIHAIFGLLSQAKAHGVLMIGGAGCTLGTLLTRAQRQATIVDVNPASFVIARKYFGLPDSVICHIADGEAFLRDEPGVYDAIVLDAFHGDFIPAHLKSSAFLGLVRDRLAPGGVFIANILVQNDFDNCADRLAKSMKDVWPDVRLLDAVGITDRNAIVMAGRVSELREPDLLIEPEVNAKAIKKQLGRLRFRARKASRLDYIG